MRKALLALPVAAALLTAFSTPAFANGRFPETNAVFLAQNDPDLVLLRVTFGLLISHDRGKSWDWVCENSIGLAGIEDPMYWVAPNGTFVGSTFQGVTVSHDKGCNFSFVGGPLKDGIFIDLTSRAAEPNTVVTFQSGYDNIDDAGNVTYKSVLYESKDQAETFTAMPWTFDGTLFGETVDMAPSDDQRLYVTAVRAPGVTPSGVFMVSLDRGKTFEELPFPLVAGERAPFIAAVDPTNADRVYVRTWSGADKPGRIMLTEDAGKNWKTIYTSQAALSGFALAPDGKKVYLGGPKEGLQVASTTDFAFTQKSTIEVGCLTLAADGLWACSSEKSGFIAAFSKDDGATFDTKAHFCDIRGALACDGTSKTTTQCAQVWPTQQSVLGCDAFADGGADGGPNAGDGSTTTTGAKVDDDSGCSCRTTPGKPLTAAFAGIGGAAFALLFAWCRRSRH
ncbi:BNR/Asp-box repeat domain protein [Labilithrix luteola]|uniref:BNR/Asp-box repeat domain protein n=1 Tax=Labilithrix luteola TaxID=1391654 RepID=A0A0K1PYT8_9BACT|nr:hypothetical protein [Labilithrix luteola]AKU98561.1 BNR/Asp-box repeat domain protein [Labilithrix luteola]